MKKTILSVVALCLVSLLQATETFDENTVYQRMYRVWSQPGDNADGESDVSSVANSDFIRMLISLNELTTDVAHCSWGDSDIPELNENRWDTDLSQADGMMQRLQFIVYTCNLYLENTEGGDATRRAEARFLRAMAYLHGIDLFGNIPFTTSSASHSLYDMRYAEQSEEGPVWNRPEQHTRAEVFQFVESELLDCATLLPAPGSAQAYRPDQAAVWLLLARLYLNAEVYTGTPQWEKARTMARRVVDCTAYSLCPTYRNLFCSDNDSNGAEKEILLAAREDAELMPGYNGTTYLIAACYDYDMPANGMMSRWSGLRARRQLVEKFDGMKNTDARYLFWEDRSLDIMKATNFNEGYGILKFTNGTAENPYSDGFSFYASTDMPLLRKAEAYLTLAEANIRLNDGVANAEALEAINSVRSRAGASTLSTATLNDLADEWAREFYMEGRRRSDLIRLGLYTGDKYLWQWKGGTFEGRSIETWRSLFPLPDAIMAQSESYEQNTGYADINKVTMAPTFTLHTPSFASETVNLNEVHSLMLSWERPNIDDPYGYSVGYQLQLSPSGRFDTSDDPGDYVNWGVGNSFYVPLTYERDGLQAEALAETIDGIVLSHRRVQMWSQRPQEPVDIYFRCVAYLANKQSTSNIVKVRVMPYANNVSSTLFYLVGPGVGDGQQLTTAEGIGTSMLPMDADMDNYSLGWGSFAGGTYTLTTWLEKDKPFWLRQMINSNVTTSDGTPDGVILPSSWGNDFPLPTEGDMFRVDESGWYTLRLTPNPMYRLEGDEWVRDKAMEWNKTEAPAGGATQVGISGAATAQLQATEGTQGRLWYGVVTLAEQGSLLFDIDGRSYGHTDFPAGVATAGGNAIIAPAGRYVVTINTATGFYNFYDTNDRDFLHTPLSPWSLMYKAGLQPVVNDDLVVSEAEPVNLDEESVTVCNIDQLPEGMDRDELTLVVGDTELPMGADGSVDAQLLNRAVARAEAASAKGTAFVPTKAGYSPRLTATTNGKTVDAYVYGPITVDGLTTLAASNTFTITVLYANYYLVGWMNGWVLSDDGYPLQTSDGTHYSIDLDPNVGNYEWGRQFIVASEQAVRNSDWDAVNYRTWNGQPAWTGSFAANTDGAWDNFSLPDLPDGVEMYHLTFDFSTMTFDFTPPTKTPTGIYSIEHYSIEHSTLNIEHSPAIYDLSGRRVGSTVNGQRSTVNGQCSMNSGQCSMNNGQLKKGIYIWQGKKVVR